MTIGVTVNQKNKTKISFAYRSLCKKIDLSIKKGQGQPKFIIFQASLAHVPNAAY